ncbi:MAG: peptidoglycan-binding protein [Pseudomonadota bacterium]
MDRMEPSFDMPMHAATDGHDDPFRRSRYFDPSAHAGQDHGSYSSQSMTHEHHAAHAQLYATGQPYDQRQDYADHDYYAADHHFDDPTYEPAPDRKRRFFGRVPLIAGLLIFGVWAPITFNAMWMQDGPHPAPFFESSAQVAAVADEDDASAPTANSQTSTPREAPRSVNTASVQPVQNVSTAPTPAPQVAEQPAPAPSAEQQELAEIQSVLQRLGLYDGAIDGLYGPRTQTAIEAFESGHGLAVTGRPSPQLREKLGLPGQSSASAVQVVQTPAAPPAEGIEGLLQSNPTPVATADPIAQAIAGHSDAQLPASDYAQAYSQVQQSAPASALPSAAPAAPQPGLAPPTGVQTISITPPANATALLDAERPRPGDPRVLHVQRLLADLAYAPGSIDGQLGPSTRAAIMRFEADRNMPQTGQVSDQLLNALAAMTGVAYGG